MKKKNGKEKRIYTMSYSLLLQIETFYIPLFSYFLSFLDLASLYSLKWTCKTYFKKKCILQSIENNVKDSLSNFYCIDQFPTFSEKQLLKQRIIHYKQIFFRIQNDEEKRKKLPMNSGVWKKVVSFQPFEIEDSLFTYAWKTIQVKSNKPIRVIIGGWFMGTIKNGDFMIDVFSKPICKHFDMVFGSIKFLTDHQTTKMKVFVHEISSKNGILWRKANEEKPHMCWVLKNEPIIFGEGLCTPIYLR